MKEDPTERMQIAFIVAAVAFVPVAAIVFSWCLITFYPESLQRRSAPLNQAVTVGPRQIGFSDALSQGLIKVAVTGAGLEAIKVTIQPTTQELLQTEVPIGVIFVPESGEVQRMIVTHAAYCAVGRESVTITVPVACANMHKKVPRWSDKFSVGTRVPEDDLRKLLELTEFSKEKNFRIKQFAVWTITDNPARDKFVGIGFVGHGSGPDAGEIAAIKAYFDKAGISSEKYNLFR